MLYSSSLALIMMLEVEPKERLMRGGAVMMRECGSAKRLPFLPEARIMAALPKACVGGGHWRPALLYRPHIWCMSLLLGL